MRLFVGVWLSEAMKQEVVEGMNLLRQGCLGFKWTDSNNLHFTLKFLGEVPNHQINDLKQALQAALAGNKSFELRLGELGCFPPKGIPRILWIGVHTGQQSLVTLAESVEASTIQHGFPPADKPFKPHLTIARAKDDRPKVQLPESMKPFQSETKVTGFSLIESRLYSSGPVYRAMETFRLKD